MSAHRNDAKATAMYEAYQAGLAPWELWFGAHELEVVQQPVVAA